MANGSSQSCEAGFESLNLACSTQRVQEQNMTNVDMDTLNPYCLLMNSANNFKLLMQEAPNSYEKDEQQERVCYDNAN